MSETSLIVPTCARISMTGKIDLQKLQAMTAEERSRLYENAHRLIDSGGREIIRLIEASGLSLKSSSGGIAKDSPVYLMMEQVIRSPQGRAAALEATAKRLPAMAYIDPLLQEKLGSDYSPQEMITVAAGSIVGELMRELGYDTMKSASLPKGCIAKSAAVWVPRNIAQRS